MRELGGMSANLVQGPSGRVLVGCQRPASIEPLGYRHPWCVSNSPMGETSLALCPSCADWFHSWKRSQGLK